MLVHVVREYKLNKIFLSCLGLWPFQNKLVKNCLLTFHFVLEMSYYPFEILLFYDHRDDPRLMFESFYQIVFTVGFLTRLWNGVLNHDKFQRMYETMNAHWDIFTDDLEVRILKEYAGVARKFTLFYCILLYSLMSVFVLFPLRPLFLDLVLPLNESRPKVLIFEVEFRVDKDEYFTPILCYIIAIIVVGISINITVDSMYFTYVTHACSLFSIISKKIENVMKLDKNDYDCCVNAELQMSDERAVYKRYVDCLRKYQLALDETSPARHTSFVDILNSTYQMVTFFFLFLMGATLSLIGIRIVYVSNIDELLRFGGIIVGILVQLMVICYPGQKLMDETQNVFYKACEVKWYTFSPRLKTLMSITLYRSIVPCTLTAGKLIPLSMRTYALVIRTGMSYFTTFLSLKD